MCSMSRGLNSMSRDPSLVYHWISSSERLACLYHLYYETNFLNGRKEFVRLDLLLWKGLLCVFP